MSSMDLETDSVASWERRGIIYDAAIAFSSEDAEEAKHVMEMMNNIDLGGGRKPNVCLYNNPQFSPSKVKKICCVVQNCSFIFCLLTENCKGDHVFNLFLEEAIGITRLDTCGNCGNPPTLVQKKYFSVRPLHTQLKETRRYGIPLGLTTIEGFCLKRPSIEEDLKFFFNCFKNEKCMPKDSLKTSLTAFEGTSSAQPVSATLVSEAFASAVVDPAFVTSFGKDINKELALFQENSENKDNCRIPENEDNEKTEDEMYAESTYFSNSPSNCPSIAISQKCQDLVVQDPPLYRTRQKAKSWCFKDMIENGRLETYGNSHESSRNLMDSASFSTAISRKMSRKPKGKKVVNRMIGCNFLNVDLSTRALGNPYRGTLSMQDNDDSDETEWSNVDPMTQIFRNNEGSDKQDSAEQTVVPSNSTETLDPFNQNDTAKTPIEESTDWLPEVISNERADSVTTSHIYQKPYDIRSYSTVAVYDSNEDNPEDLLQAEDFSTCPSLPSVDNGIESLDNQEVLQQGSESPDPLLQGSESHDPMEHGSGSLDPLLQGSESHDPMEHGSESLDPLLQGSESLDPLLYGSESPDPLLQGSESPDPLLQGSESPDPLLQGSESPDPLLQGSESPDPLLQGSGSHDPLLLGSESHDPMQHGSGSHDPLLQGSESHDPMEHGSGSLDPLLQGSEGQYPMQHGSGSLDPLLLGSEGQYPMEHGSGSLDPMQQGSGSPDPMQQGSGSLDPMQQGSESHDPMQQGSGSHDPMQQGSGSHDPMQQGSGSHDPMQQGSGSHDPMQQGSGSHDPMQQGSGGLDPMQQGSGGYDPLLLGSDSQTPLQLKSEREELWTNQESIPGEELVSSLNQSLGQEDSICQKVLSREEPLSMGSIRRECIENADGTRVPPLTVNQDQLVFSRAEENNLHSSFSQPETFPFSYHSLHSNRFADRQMSFEAIAKLIGLCKIDSDELD